MFSKESVILLLLLSLVSMISSQQSTLEFVLEVSQTNCLYEYFPESTLVILEVIPTGENVQIELKKPDQSILQSRKNETFKEAFTAETSGYYEVCIMNYGKSTTTIYFDLKYGVAAKDYSSIAKTKDLQPIDLELTKITDKKNTLNHYVRVSQQHEKMFEQSLDSISSKIVFYSMILMAMMIIIGVIETVYLKKFMERRKII